MEETFQALLDEGALVRNGQLKLTRSLAELKVPPTVQATLAARIDRRSAAEKELLQILAVIGKEIALETRSKKSPAKTRSSSLRCYRLSKQASSFTNSQPSGAPSMSSSTL
jgi:hypothetical protein